MLSANVKITSLTQHLFMLGRKLAPDMNHVDISTRIFDSAHCMLQLHTDSHSHKLTTLVRQLAQAQLFRR